MPRKQKQNIRKKKPLWCPHIMCFSKATAAGFPEDWGGQLGFSQQCRTEGAVITISPKQVNPAMLRFRKGQCLVKGHSSPPNIAREMQTAGNQTAVDPIRLRWLALSLSLSPLHSTLHNPILVMRRQLSSQPASVSVSWLPLDVISSHTRSTSPAGYIQ